MLSCVGEPLKRSVGCFFQTMRNILKQAVQVAIIFSFSIVGVYNSVAQQNRPIDQKRAVAVAEKFVNKHNKSGDESTIDWHESEKSLPDWESEQSQPVQGRAVKAFIKEELGQTFWAVQFLFRRQHSKRSEDLGREVRVSLDGRKVWMSEGVVPVQATRVFGDCVEEARPARPQ